MPRTSLAWKNLTHQPARTVVSVGGIGFAILLMYMQLGFLGAVGDTAANVYRLTPYHVVVRSPDYLHVYDPRSIDESVLSVLASLPQVEGVCPLDLGVAPWQNPITGDFRAVAVMGVDLEHPAIRLAELKPLLPLLRRGDHVLIDRTSRADFGPLDGVRFGPQDVGRTADIMGKRVRIAGTFEMGTGLAANGAVLASRDGFRRIAPGGHRGLVSMAFVSLSGGVSIDQGLDAIRRRLREVGGPLSRADVLSVEEAVWRERRRWYTQTPVGIIFAMGVALAVVVGGVICYMVLAADVIAKLPEYATLKAIGYNDRFLCTTLLSQACLLASVSLPLATLAALALYEATSRAAGIPIHMNWQRIVVVSLISYAMCSSAGWIALRKLTKAEPASLF